MSLIILRENQKYSNTYSEFKNTYIKTYKNQYHTHLKILNHYKKKYLKNKYFLDVCLDDFIAFLFRKIIKYHVFNI